MPNLKCDYECSVCGRCFLACKAGAICFEPGKLNYFPVVDYNKCLECKKCEEECGAEVQGNKEGIPEFWLGYSKDEKILERSSSGGIFSELAYYVLEKGGIIFGAAYNLKENKVEHTGITKWEDIDQLRKSKYVQSDWISVCEQVKRAVLEEKYILFTGTPCQVSSMKKFYGNYEKILFMDLFCHGVLNANIFKDYLHFLNEGITHIDFRTEGSYQNFNLSIYSDKKVIINERCDQNILYQLFISSAGLKKSCLACVYADKIHDADITIGDFDNKIYALEKGMTAEHPSIIAINTLKGKFVFDKILSRLNVVKVEDFSVIEQYYVSHKSKKGSWGYEERVWNRFQKDYISKGFISAAIYSSYPKEMVLIDSVNSQRDRKEEVYLYGAGQRGKVIRKIINIMRPEWIIKGYIVSEKGKDINMVEGIPLFEGVDLIDRKNSNVIVSVYEKYKMEIVKELKKEGFTNIFYDKE